MPDTRFEERQRGPDDTLGVDEARNRIVAACSPLPAIDEELDRALGLTLAGDIVSTWDLPPFDNSAMDGFALRATDTRDADRDAPATLQVAGHIAAGSVAERPLRPGEAIRIMTGAPIPVGADAVERVERIENVGDDRIAIAAPVHAGENIRPAGEDVRAGDTVLAAGDRIGPAEVGLLAAIGVARVPVHRRPRVGVLVSGDEVITPGTTPAAGQIFNSNGPMIAALVRQLGADPIDLGIAGDTVAAMRTRLSQVHDVDLLITTGGVSVGDFDIVRDVLRDEGDVALWSVRIKPGKPLAFGRVGDLAVLGLPGNPVAAAVAFHQFARPAILTMLGRRDIAMPVIEASSRDRVVNRGRRSLFARVRVERTPDGYIATLAGAQGSAILTSLARSNGLLVVGEDVDVIEPGDVVTVQMPGWDLA